MRRCVLILVAIGLLANVAGAAAPPGRTAAVSELTAAIADEEAALKRLRRTPPAWGPAFSKLSPSDTRLGHVIRYASTLGAPTVENSLHQAREADWYAEDQILRVLGEREHDDVKDVIRRLEEALRLKRGVLPIVTAAVPPTGTPQCSDGKDNDGDGVTDWNLEPGCTSARDVRERSPFTCALQTTVESGRLVLSGSCSGAFSGVEFTLLDGLQLNGRFDIQHAPSCSPPTVTAVRCSTKTGEQNPEHKVRVSFTTTKRARGQRIRTRFFDQRQRRIRSYDVRVR